MLPLAATSHCIALHRDATTTVRSTAVHLMRSPRPVSAPWRKRGRSGSFKRGRRGEGKGWLAGREPCQPCRVFPALLAFTVRVLITPRPGPRGLMATATSPAPPLGAFRCLPAGPHCHWPPTKTPLRRSRYVESRGPCPPLPAPPSLPPAHKGWCATPVPQRDRPKTRRDLLWGLVAPGRGVTRCDAVVLPSIPCHSRSSGRYLGASL